MKYAGLFLYDILLGISEGGTWKHYRITYLNKTLANKEK